MKPLKIHSLLASTPQSPLQFSQKISLGDGSEWELADPKATRALVALMDMQAVMGGAASHFGGPAAFAEIMSCLHGIMFEAAKNSGKEWHELFNFVNDAGHCENGLYALKANYGFADLSLNSLKGFRSIESGLTGHGESHLFPEGVLLSNGPLGSSVAQAQGLAQGDALAERWDRVTLLALSDGAAMEGEAKEAFAALPGFAKKGKVAPFVMIISDNNTKLSGRIDEQSYSMAPTFSALKTMGWDLVVIEQGHDLKTLMETFLDVIERVKKDPKTPICLQVKTVKGYGVKSTEESASGGHGFPLKTPEKLSAFLQEIYGTEDVPKEMQVWCEELEQSFVESQKQKATVGSSSVSKEKVQVGVSAALTSMKEKGYPLVSVSSDLPGSTGVAGFQKAFPESVIDVGIAESNMVSVAAGLSKQGFIPIVDTFSQFGVTKGALPFIMSSLSQAPVIGIFSHAGFQDAADGASHQSLAYFSMTASIPGVETYCLSCSAEAEALVTQAIEDFKAKRELGEVPVTRLFFLGRETFTSHVGSEKEYQLGQSQVVFSEVKDQNQSVTLLTAGPLVFQAVAAAKKLVDEGFGVEVLNASVVNKPDNETLSQSLAKTGGNLITIEDHQKVGGLGSLYLHSYLDSGKTVSCYRSLGVKGEFGQSAYKADQLYAKHGLDQVAIVQAAREMLDPESKKNLN